jgi:G6PDH family F420-dependent oxidoreductase
MLEEAVDVIRKLWTGEIVSWEGKHYRVDHARIYNVPATPPEIYVSGFGPKAMELAARIGDGFINAAPDAEMVRQFKEQSGGKPAHAGAKVAFAPTQDEGWEHAHRLWPDAGLPGEMAQVLPTPEHFEQASSRDDELDPQVGGRGCRRVDAPEAGHVVPGGRVRRALRREHGTSLPRHDRVLR